MRAHQSVSRVQADCRDGIAMIEKCPIHGTPQSEIPCSACERAEAAGDRPLSNTLFGDATSLGEGADQSLSVRERELELERQRLELERQRLELESRRLELDAAAAEPKEPKRESGSIPARRRSGRASPTSRRLKKKRATSGERPVPTSSRRLAARTSGRVPAQMPRSGSSGLVLALLIIGIIFLSSAGAALVFLPRSTPSTEYSGNATTDTPELAALRRKAESGDGKAMLNLGSLYYSGVGAPRDLIEAKRWLQRAAEAGDADVSVKAVMTLSQIRAYEDQLAAAKREASEADRARVAREKAEADRAAAIQKEARAREERDRLSREAEAKRLAATTEAEHAQRRGDMVKILDVLEADLRDPTYDEVVEANEELAKILDDDALTPELRDRASRIQRADLREATESVAASLLEAASELAAEKRYEAALAELEKRGLLGTPDGPDVLELTSRCKTQIIAIEEAHRSEREAASRAAHEARELRITEVREAARRRCENWFALRAPNRLACSKCSGSGEMPCRQCKGTGYTKTIVVGTSPGSGRKTCSRCRGHGRLGCRDVHGYDPMGLKLAFWDYISPSARGGVDRDAFCVAVVERRSLSSLVGDALTISSATIDSVVVEEARVIVTARVQWYSARWDEFRQTYNPQTGTYSVTLQREKGTFYIALGPDSSPERLLTGEEPAPPVESEPEVKREAPGNPVPEAESEVASLRPKLDEKRLAQEGARAPQDSIASENALRTLRARLAVSPLTDADATAGEQFLASWPKSAHRADVLDLLQPYYLRTGWRWPIAKTTRIDRGKSEAAIRSALDWLARHQDPDGKWDCDLWSRDDFRVLCRPKPGLTAAAWDRGDGRYDVGVTALATLAFLSMNETHRTGAHKETVDRALNWLISQQGDRGAIGFRNRTGEEIYNHAIACLALVEAYLLTREPRVGFAAQNAVDFTVSAQNPSSGWKYGVRPGRSDTSVTGWMTLGLAAARRAKLNVPASAFEGAISWIDRTTSDRGATGYQTPGGGSSYIPAQKGKFEAVPAMTAVAAVVRLAAGRDDSGSGKLAEQAKLISADSPSWRSPSDTRKCNFYYWHYGSLALSAVGGSSAQTWLRSLRETLAARQRTSGCAAGSWDPVGEWCVAGGRVYATAMGALSLGAIHRNPGIEPGRGADDPARPASAGGNEPEPRTSEAETVLAAPRALLREGLQQAREAINNAGNGRPDAALTALALARARLSKAQGAFIRIAQDKSEAIGRSKRKLHAGYEIIDQYLSTIDTRLDELDALEEQLEDY